MMIPTSIILHHSLTKDGETVSWGAIRHYHTIEKGWNDIGYHYGIEKVGHDHEIFVGRMMTEQGAHCHGHNDYSLGICFIGNFDAEPPPSVQWDLGVRLVRSLLNVFSIEKMFVYPHRKFAPWKTCPGRQFDTKQFVKEL